MKKLIVFSAYLFLFIFSITKVNAESTPITPTLSYTVLNDTTVKISWNSTGKTYELCPMSSNKLINGQWVCTSIQITDQTFILWPLAQGKTESFGIIAVNGAHQFVNGNFISCVDPSCFIFSPWSNWTSVTNNYNTLTTTTTTTIPQTTTSTLVLKKDQKIPLKDLINTTTTIPIDRTITSTTIDWVETVFPTTATTILLPITKDIKHMNNEDTKNLIIISVVIFFGLYLIYLNESNKRSQRLSEKREDEKLQKEREYELRLRQIKIEEELKFKELNLNEKKVLTDIKLEEHKVINLGEKKLDLDYELKSKEIDFDRIKDERDFTATQLDRERNHNLKREEIQVNKDNTSFDRLMSVTQKEREHLLKERELDIKEKRDSEPFIDVIESGKDVKFHIKK